MPFRDKGQGLMAPAARQMTGLASVLPLWLFSLAAARLPVTVMGFFQFVLPLTQLLVAVLIYRHDLVVQHERGGAGSNVSIHVGKQA